MYAGTHKKTMSAVSEQSGVGWKVNPKRLAVSSVQNDVIGLTVYKNSIFVRGVGEYGSKTLYRSFNGSVNYEVVWRFDESVSHMLATPFGFFVQTREFVYKSRDLKDWKKVFKLTTNTILMNGWDFDPNQEVLYFGEYHLKEGEAVHIYRGVNGGEDWEVAWRFEPNEVRHVHALQYDKYSERIWVGTGDTDDQSKVMFTEDGFQSLIEFGRGEDFRLTSFAFTSDYLCWGTDSPRTSQKIIRSKRNQVGVIETIKEFRDKPFYFSLVTSSGSVIFSSLSESIESVEIDKKNRVFELKGDNVEEVFSLNIKNPEMLARLYPFGEDIYGNIYFCGVYMEGGPTNQLFKTKLS
jgi:hypothetical protein